MIKPYIMKKLCLMLLAVLLFAVPMEGKKKGQAIATFKVVSHDFGYIMEDNGPVSYDFEFTNTGGKPLLIVSAHASCGCTKPAYPKHPIAPGESGVIKVTYKPKNRPGTFDKVVSVTTNGKSVSLRIKGTVVPGGSKK